MSNKRDKESQGASTANACTQCDCALARAFVPSYAMKTCNSRREVMAWSNTWTFLDGAWHQGNVNVMGVRDHAFWLGSSVFDGGRTFEGVMPDLRLHMERVNRSAVALGLDPVVSPDRWMELAVEGLKKFGPNPALYVRPMYWGTEGSMSGVMVEPASTRWCLSMYETPMPEPKGAAITLSPFRRPTMETMPVNAKAGCLYPNNGRALAEARGRGFDNALMCDMLGNVAELATANVFMVKDGVVMTPISNGTFLSGITRSRVLDLLKADGVPVLEKVLTKADFLTADEIFSSGNFGKVQPITRIEDRSLQPGPMSRKARELYWAYAHA
jgi:branched-chain amino acid aminotransferase